MLLKKAAYSFLYILLAGIYTCDAQNDPAANLSDFINKKADSLYRETKVPGIFIGVSSNGKTTYYDFGYAEPDTKTRFDSATLFEAGSITKTFTAYVLISVLEENKIADTNRIVAYLPDSVKTNTALGNISFLELMNHTSGLPRLPVNMSLMENAMAPYDQYDSGKLFEYLKTAIPKPDGKSNYSNLGMGLAGVLAERISGKTYAALLDKYIFLPFKIVTAEHSIEKSVKKSQGYFEDEKTDYWNMDILAPAGGLKCTASEMMIYLKFMSNPSGKKVKVRIEKLLTPTIAINPKINVCRAWHTFERVNKPRIYWHNGGTYGFSTFAAFIRETGQAVIVVVNKYDSNAVSDALGMSIMKKMLE